MTAITSTSLSRKLMGEGKKQTTILNGYLLFFCRGIYKAYVGEDQKHIHTYEGRGSFGELALLYNMPR